MKIDPKITAVFVIAAGIASIGAAVATVNSWAPDYVKAGELEQVETKLAASLESIVKSLSNAVGQNALDIAEGDVREYKREEKEVELDLIRTDNRQDLSAQVKAERMLRLKQELRDVQGSIAKSDRRVRALKPVFSPAGTNN